MSESIDGAFFDSLRAAAMSDREYIADTVQRVMKSPQYWDTKHPDHDTARRFVQSWYQSQPGADEPIDFVV